MKIVGIDLGSRAVKIAIMEDGKIIETKKYSTMQFYRDYCDYDGKIVVNFEKLEIDGDLFVSTGYGKNNIDLKSFHPINEIKAHAYGSMFQTDLNDYVLLDVGGQDVKVVKIEKAIVTDLELNDKCAASCGRFLENMAAVLEVELEELFKHSSNPVELNSTCAVFSESELIGKIAEGISMERLCAGVNYSMYKRLQPLLTKFRSKKLVVSGGVAHNDAMIAYLRADYDEVIRLESPQYNGAIGCCYYGNEYMIDQI